MGKQVKKKARSFSLTDEEFDQLLARMKHHGFDDRNLYLLALIEADEALQMEVTLDAAKQKVLRSEQGLRLAAETATPYQPARRSDAKSSRRKPSA